jgi:hypothetical protein
LKKDFLFFRWSGGAEHLTGAESWPLSIDIFLWGFSLHRFPTDSGYQLRDVILTDGLGIQSVSSRETNANEIHMSLQANRLSGSIETEIDTARM